MNLQFIRWRVKQFCARHNCWQHFDDLVQEAVIAALKAAESFDPSKGFKFETFASYRIQGALNDYLTRERSGGISRIPRSLRDIAIEVQRAHDRLMQELERCPTTEEIARVICESIEKVEEALKLLALYFESLEALMTPEDDETGPEPIAEESSLEQRIITQIEIDRALRQLSERERHIVVEHVFFGRTFDEIARNMDFARGSVGVWYSRALKKLEDYLGGNDNNGGGDENVSS